jgi:hypothetical protein
MFSPTGAGRQLVHAQAWATACTTSTHPLHLSRVASQPPCTLQGLWSECSLHADVCVSEPAGVCGYLFLQDEKGKVASL